MRFWHVKNLSRAVAGSRVRPPDGASQPARATHIPLHIRPKSTPTHTHNRREKFVKFCFRWWSIPQLQDKDYWTCGGPDQLHCWLRVLPRPPYRPLCHPSILSHILCALCAGMQSGIKADPQPQNHIIETSPKRRAIKEILKRLECCRTRRHSASPSISLGFFLTQHYYSTTREISFCH